MTNRIRNVTIKGISFLFSDSSNSSTIELLNNEFNRGEYSFVFEDKIKFDHGV